MMAHVLLTKTAYERAVLGGIRPRSHPDWLVILYTCFPDGHGEAAESEELIEPKECQVKQPLQQELIEPKECQVEQPLKQELIKPPLKQELIKPSECKVEPIEGYKARFMQGRFAGKAKFTFLEGSSSSSGIAKGSTSSGQGSSSSGNMGTWCDPHERCAKRMLASGAEIKSSGIATGPNGLLIAKFKEGPDFEFNLTNDCHQALRMLVIDLALLRKRPAAAMDVVEAEIMKDTEGWIMEDAEEPIMENAEIMKETGGNIKDMISQKKLIYSREYHRALKTLVNQGMEKEEAKGCART